MHLSLVCVMIACPFGKDCGFEIELFVFSTFLRFKESQKAHECSMAEKKV